MYEYNKIGSFSISKYDTINTHIRESVSIGINSNQYLIYTHISSSFLYVVGSNIQSNTSPSIMAINKKNEDKKSNTTCDEDTLSLRTAFQKMKSFEMFRKEGGGSKITPTSLSCKRNNGEENTVTISVDVGVDDGECKSSRPSRPLKEGGGGGEREAEEPFYDVDLNNEEENDDDENYGDLQGYQAYEPPPMDSVEAKLRVLINECKSKIYAIEQSLKPQPSCCEESSPPQTTTNNCCVALSTEIENMVHENAVVGAQIMALEEGVSKAIQVSNDVIKQSSKRRSKIM